MPRNVTQKLIDDHLVDGEALVGHEIGIHIDQTLTQDATGTLVMLELEAMVLDRARTDCSVQYVDHNLLQQDYKNADDHLFLRSACQRFGLWYSRPGNGVSHPLHQERFGIPGATLVGSDSHTPAAGAIGMLALGAGGLEVALAIAGQPLYLAMPEVFGVRLIGQLPSWTSAKDIILEMLRRHGVAGGRGCVFEYFGPGLDQLGAMDRHVIANMGTELGATSTVFPADEEVRRFLTAQGRADDWSEWVADAGATYDREEEIDLSTLVPLIAMPQSPGNVVPVSEVAGQEIYQCYLGSSANPGYRDFAVAAEVVKGKRVHERVSFDINPASRQVLARLIQDGQLASLLEAGARLHQTGCNGCIGMGQAPATGRISLRTVPRNFPGRSGTREDQVCLVSPETAAVSALRGEITDPREASLEPPRVEEGRNETPVQEHLFEAPLESRRARQVELIKGPNVRSLPRLAPLPDKLEAPILLKVGDDISTDEILPAGAEVLPLRSNIPAIAEFVFAPLDSAYVARTRERGRKKPHALVAGDNYGQGSSREHAALAPRSLGLRLVVAKSFARIHHQNLVNFGVLPLWLSDLESYEGLKRGGCLVLEGLHRRLSESSRLELLCDGRPLRVEHRLSKRQVDVLLEGGLINHMKSALAD